MGAWLIFLFFARTARAFFSAFVAFLPHIVDARGTWPVGCYAVVYRHARWFSPRFLFYLKRLFLLGSAMGLERVPVPNVGGRTKEGAYFAGGNFRSAKLEIIAFSMLQ